MKILMIGLGCQRKIWWPYSSSRRDYAQGSSREHACNPPLSYLGQIAV